MVRTAFPRGEHPLVFDQVFHNLNHLEQMLERARAHGYQPAYVFVDRPPDEAWGGVVGRAVDLRQQGKPARTVPLEVAVPANVAAREAALEVLRRQPGLDVRVIDNRSGDFERPVITNRDEAIAYLEGRLKEVADTGALVARLRAETSARVEAGAIPADIGAALLVSVPKPGGAGAPTGRAGG